MRYWPCIAIFLGLIMWQHGGPSVEGFHFTPAHLGKWWVSVQWINAELRCISDFNLFIYELYTYIYIYIRTFFYMYLWKIFVFLHARSREESNNPFHLLLSHRSKNEFQDTFPSLGKKRVLGSQSDPFKDTLQQSNATIRNPHKMEVFMGKSSINGAFSMAMFDCQWVERQFVNHQSHENQLLMLGKHHWFKHAYQMDPNGKWPDIFLEILHSGAPDLVYVHISSVVKVIDAGLDIACHHGLMATLDKSPATASNPKSTYRVTKTW